MTIWMRSCVHSSSGLRLLLAIKFSPLPIINKLSGSTQIIGPKMAFGLDYQTSKSYRIKTDYRTWLSDLQIWYVSKERQHLRPPNWHTCLQSAVGGVPTTANISFVAAYPCWSCCPWCSCLCFTLDSAVGDVIAAILLLWYPMCSHQFWGRHLLMFQFSLVLVLLLFLLSLCWWHPWNPCCDYNVCCCLCSSSVDVQHTVLFLMVLKYLLLQVYLL